MDIAAIHAAGIKAVQDSFGDSCPVITWNGRDYKVLPGSAKLRKHLGVGGFSMDSDLMFTVLRETFGAGIPHLKDQIEYGGKKYRIQAMHRKHGDLEFHYECNDASQSA